MSLETPLRHSNYLASQHRNFQGTSDGDVVCAFQLHARQLVSAGVALLYVWTYVRPLHSQEDEMCTRTDVSPETPCCTSERANTLYTVKNLGRTHILIGQLNVVQPSKRGTPGMGARLTSPAWPSIRTRAAPTS